MLMSEVGLAEVPAVLPGARFSDTFDAVSRERIDAGVAMERGFKTVPGWVDSLVRLRDRLVAPFGLKTRDETARADRAVPFPILEHTPERIVMGTDDRHLDFRVILGANPMERGGTRVSCTTLVRPRNLLGWLYLLAVLPFHKLIVAATVRRIVA
ncbi:hypothetical protein A33O_15950 [Nitratireductor aquibiodomus RA22]|uniref:DUF2867 domain-containing protein n=1 Tax=Nitratireductor aquibiodomus RA22 TaxID=1189611 RepID=I5BUM5_9HYPH|nr:DUF2867 domain-containing protein [Nitratireductor aquibiodomus]EIM73277.1 hypothetical protein A33O_15950 [Nitratireductor aquibiodomus RA22]